VTDGPHGHRLSQRAVGPDRCDLNLLRFSNLVELVARPLRHDRFSLSLIRTYAPSIAGAAAYSASVTWSPHVALLPFSSTSSIAMWVMNRVGVAPCQWCSPGSKNTRSPGRMTSIGPPRRCARPTPSSTKMVWPFGCVCHAVRAPGVKWTVLAVRRETPFGAATLSTYTGPVNRSLDPLVVWMLLRVTCMYLLPVGLMNTTLRQDIHLSPHS